MARRHRVAQQKLRSTRRMAKEPLSQGPAVRAFRSSVRSSERSPEAIWEVYGVLWEIYGKYMGNIW